MTTLSERPLLSRKELNALARSTQQPVSEAVAVVFMPGQADHLAELRAAEVPHLIIVAANFEAPIVVGDCEEWIRFPAEASDISARLQGLRQRAARRPSPRPVLTDDGLLRAGGSWVALSRTEQRIAQSLVARFGELVPMPALAESLGDGTNTRLTTCIARLRRRIEPLGLIVRSVRLRGYLMTYASAI